MNTVKRYKVIKKGWVWLVEEKGLSVKVIKTIKSGKNEKGVIIRNKTKRRRGKSV